MQIASLGYCTDLIFPRFDGEVIDRGEYLVIRTPDNPTFHWGNFLLFDGPPALGDFDRWRDLFHQEIGPVAQVGHYAFGWDSVDGETGETAPFVEAGFNVEQSVVLTAQTVHRPPKWNEAVTIRSLQNNFDWEQATENQIACREAKYSEEGFRAFKIPKMARYRRMTNAGIGAWFGAFVGPRLVGDCGVFTDGDRENRVARFQSVGVHPGARRQGVCGTMVYEAARFALDVLRAEILVMVADPDYHAARIYESVGFRAAEKQVGMSWWDLASPAFTPGKPTQPCPSGQPTQLTQPKIKVHQGRVNSAT